MFYLVKVQMFFPVESILLVPVTFSIPIAFVDKEFSDFVSTFFSVAASFNITGCCPTLCRNLSQKKILPTRLGRLYF